MAYTPVSGSPIQYSNESNELASGYYLKFYIANTTTPLSMATDSTGGTLLAKCKLNANGMPITNPLDDTTTFIPYIDQRFRYVIYKNEADADANTTANAFENIADVFPLIVSETIVTSVDSVEDLAGFEGSVDGQQISRASWHPGWSATSSGVPVGSVVLAWNPTGDRTDHNGGTIFSPTVPWTTTTADYLNAVGETAPTTAGTWVVLDWTLEVWITWFGAIGDNSTDSYASIQAAIDAGTVSGVGSYPVFIPDGLFRTSATLTIPVAMRFFGAGRWSSSISALSGLTGPVLTDNGNAAKIILEKFEVSGVDAAGCTALIEMGKTIPVGTEGHFTELFLRGGVTQAASNPIGLDIVGNVFFATKISSIYCSTAFNEGANSVFISYIDCVALGCYDYAYNVNTGAKITNCEIEAPDNNCIGVYIQRSAEITGLTYSPSNGKANTYVVEVDSAALSAELISVYINTSTATLTGLVKDNRATYEDDTRTSQSKYLNRLESEYIASPDLYINDRKLQSFQLLIQNDAGTIKHSMHAIGKQGTASSYISEINAASTTAVATPTGADASTAFASGGKISSASTFVFLFDAEGFNADTVLLCSMHASNINGIYANTFLTNTDVNGTTQDWVAIAFYDGTSGGTLDLTALAVGEYLRVGCIALI